MTTTATLTAEYTAYCAQHFSRSEPMSAEELQAEIGGMIEGETDVAALSELRANYDWLSRFIARWETAQRLADITDKWVGRIGLGFHPDTRGADYVPAMSAAEIAEYDRDIAELFELPGCPYEAGLEAMARAGLIK